MHLADYLITKHSMFLLEIKQRTPHAEKTVVFTTLEPKNKTISFFIQNDSNNHCLHRISYVLCFLFTQCLLKHGATRSVACLLLTLSKLLGSCNKQEEEIDVKTQFSIKIVLVLTWLI